MARDAWIDGAQLMTVVSRSSRRRPWRKHQLRFNESEGRITLISCSPLVSVTADAQTLRDLTRLATSVMSMRPCSFVIKGETEGINEATFSKTGEHNSSVDLFPSLDREIAVRFNQSIRPLVEIGRKNLESRAKRCQWPFVRDQGRFLPLRPRRGSNASASTRSPPGPRS